MWHLPLFLSSHYAVFYSMHQPNCSVFLVKQNSHYQEITCQQLLGVLEYIFSRGDEGICLFAILIELLAMLISI